MGVQKLDWPSQSPDLSPIQHLSDELDSRLRSQPNRPSSLQAVTSAAMDAWNAIPVVTYQTLVKSLRKRVQAVIHPCGYGHELLAGMPWLRWDTLVHFSIPSNMRPCYTCMEGSLSYFEEEMLRIMKRDEEEIGERLNQRKAARQRKDQCQEISD
ncbi:hypothetical protein TNCV_2467991 [Trichonephila clavipes]|nr:hypothetical protein TNCV_2467991 [Trichonephila clavipes]